MHMKANRTVLIAAVSLILPSMEPIVIVMTTNNQQTKKATLANRATDSYIDPMHFEGRGTIALVSVHYSR